MRFVLAIICFVIALGHPRYRHRRANLPRRARPGDPDAVSNAPGARRRHRRGRPQRVPADADRQALRIDHDLRRLRANVRRARVGRQGQLQRGEPQRARRASCSRPSTPAASRPFPTRPDRTCGCSSSPFDQATDFPSRCRRPCRSSRSRTAKSPAPSTISLVWPLDNSVPWAGPLILVGAIALLVGLILLLIAFNHLRKHPRTAPHASRECRSFRGSRASRASRARRSRRQRGAAPSATSSPWCRRWASALLVLVRMRRDPAAHDLRPRRRPSSAAAALTKVPAVTTAQLQEIIRSISSAVTAADAKFNVKLLKTRMAGPALDDRLANYTIRQANPRCRPPSRSRPESSPSICRRPATPGRARCSPC